jgi:uroporphyrinogen decarboxylase
MHAPANITPYDCRDDRLPGNIFDRYYDDIERPAGTIINKMGVMHVPGSMYHFTHIVSPLRNADTLSEIEKFKFPSHCDCRREDKKVLRDAVIKAHSEGKVARCYIGHMYEDAWQIRDYQKFLMDMVLQPEICEYILDRLMEYNIETAVAGAEAGADFIRLGDDVANQRTLMFSIDMWRHFIKPRWAKVIAEARKIKTDIAVWYHSDGNIMSIVPELIEIGVDILNPVQPECMDIMEVKRKFGRQIVIDGAIGTQSVMPFGSAEDVRKAVRNVKEVLGYDGALIISPTHVLEPEVPISNVEAFFDECKK